MVRLSAMLLRADICRRAEGNAPPSTSDSCLSRVIRSTSRPRRVADSMACANSSLDLLSWRPFSSRTSFSVTSLLLPSLRGSESMKLRTMPTSGDVIAPTTRSSGSSSGNFAGAGGDSAAATFMGVGGIGDMGTLLAIRGSQSNRRRLRSMKAARWGSVMRLRYLR